MSHLTLWIWTSTVRLTYPLEEVSKSKQNTKKTTLRLPFGGNATQHEATVKTCFRGATPGRGRGNPLVPNAALRRPRATCPAASRIEWPRAHAICDDDTLRRPSKGRRAPSHGEKLPAKGLVLKLLRMDCLVRQLCGRNASCSWLSCYTTKYDQTPHIP